ncbi:MAG: hypothetical protein CL947_00660 [Epsilonproteobacteria bacterium]|nr:hypothetical protein [Campylobacterota bacterium]
MLYISTGMLSVQLSYISRILFFLLSSTVVCSLQKEQTVLVDCFSDQYKQQLSDVLPEKFIIDSVLYQVDFDYDKNEIAYLTGLRDNSETTKQEVMQACFYLKQIDRFKKINLEVEKVDTKYRLCFYLSGHILFSRLLVSGTIRDKDFYKNMYLLDMAEVFDQQKHRHSLENIKKIFYDYGYCNATIKDTIKESKDSKSVVVALDLVKGAKFLIDNVSFTIDAVGSVLQADVLRMKKKIEEICYKRLHAKVYSEELVKRIEHKIHVLLERYGFMNFDLIINKEVREKDHKVDILFSITLEQKKEIVFLGNHYFKKQDIIDHLLMYGKSSWHFPSSIIVDELVQLYKNKGFWQVAISVKDEKNRIVCSINEGSRIGVTTIDFKDNNHFSDNQLVKNAFQLFLKTKYFDKDLLKKSIDQLIRLYKQSGFWDIKVVKEEVVPLKKDRIYKIVLTLDEGKQRQIGRCRIPQYPELEHQGPFARSKKEIGTGFDQMIILEQKQWLLRHFRNLGYNKVLVEHELQEVANYLDVVWNIVLQEQAVKFGKTLVIGNSVIPPSAIMREIAFETGDDWDKSKLEDTLKRLRELEVFESVQIYPSRDLDNNLQKPIFVKVIDADCYEFRTRIGMQQIGKDFRLRRGFTYKIGGSFFVRNPLSMGDRFVFEGDFTKFYRNFTASYQFPWLFTKSIRCHYKAYDTLYNQPVYIGSKVSLYQAGQRGFLYGMTKSFKKTTVSGSLGIEFMGIKEADQPQLHTIIDYEQSLLGKKTGYVFFEPTIIWQQVDTVLNPKRGHLSFVSCKGMIDIDTKTSFLKLLVEHSFYVPLRDVVVLAIRMRGGHVFNREYTSLIPIERFYLGGASSLRGYERDYCPPLGTLTIPIEDVHAHLPDEACDVWKYAPQGGRTMFNLNTEVRFSIYKSLGGVIFNDIGALFKDSINKALFDGSDNFLGGTGFGIRYDTPIGPLRFDLGFKWNKNIKDFESRWVWYLTLGHAF